jgi:hypothetical protein
MRSGEYAPFPECGCKVMAFFGFPINFYGKMNEKSVLFAFFEKNTNYRWGVPNNFVSLH